MESRWPHGRGDTGARIAAFDWSATSLGAIESWPQSLRTAVNLMLDTARPCYIAWGEELISLFNDGYIPILGSKYPRALGQPYSELFGEIWDEYRPVVEATIGGQAQSFTDQPVPLLGRDLAMSWFTFTWTPLRDDSDVIRGFFCSADETTEKVLTQQALEAAQQQALLASQERYKTLFEAIDEGFCIIELLFDDQGRPFDYPCAAEAACAPGDL